MYGTPITLSSLDRFITGAVQVFFALAAVAVVAGLVYAGLLMTTAGNDKNKFQKGRDMLRQVVVGAVIIFGVGLIVRTIANFAQNPGQVVR